MSKLALDGRRRAGTTLLVLSSTFLVVATFASGMTPMWAALTAMAVMFPLSLVTIRWIQGVGA